MKENKKLLITGAFGLVGSNICKVLESDYPEIEITKVKYDEIPEGKFDYCIYGSGYGQPIQFSKNKLETIRIHSGNPLHATFNSTKKDGTFLYISSSEVYSGAPSPHKETDIGTTTPQHPRACYIEGKRCGEAICMAYKEQGYDVKIARLALAYGPGTKKGDTRVLNQFIEQAIVKKQIDIRDKGKVVRTYAYVEDVARMMLNILFEGEEVVYNVGGTDTIDIFTLATLIAKETGAKVYLGEDDLKGAPSEVKLDITKYIEEFPDDTYVPFVVGLKRTIEYQKELYGIK